MSNHHVVGISQLDTVTAAVVTLPILHRLIHRTHEPIDLVFIRARHRAVKHPPSPLKVGGSAEANHSNSSQNQRASRCGKVCISVASGIAMRGHRVGCISHRVNCDRLDVLASYCFGTGAPRARTSGVTISCCSHDEMSWLQGIEKLIGISLWRRISEQFVRHNICARRLPRHGRLEPATAARAHGALQVSTDRVTLRPPRAPTPDSRRASRIRLMATHCVRE
jgi:hypothetical protein